MDEGMKSQLIGAALAFSSGTFLFVALSDLLPEVQFHRHDRIPLFLTLTAGVALMGFIALLEPHNHNGHGHNHNGQPALHNHHDDKDHHDKDDDHDHHDHEKGDHKD
jgi:zinc and cadmium transporter